MLNSWNGAGRLTRDPELHKTQSDKSVTSFSLAVDRDFKPKDGERETDFIDIVAWNATADFVAKYFQKGSMAIVSGRLQPRSWKDDDGNTHRTVEVIADNVYFGGSKNDNNSSSGNAPANNSKTSKSTPAAKPTYTPEEDSEDEDCLPF
ncbi:Single-stranded DNA-binding protein [bioreactor metagenome]|uniref:Single-stranded DNA-binding protein n=1 Tax=bioreactor metagenome TaxID=1076179 RepID=A0A644XE55_9ZZZZ